MALFNVDRYEWFSFNGSPTTITRRGTVFTITQGDVFGIRAATSKEGTVRVIIEELGKGRIFSLSDEQGRALIRCSKALRSLTNALRAA